MPQVPRDSAVPDETTLTVALLGPDEQRRAEVAGALSKHPGLRLQEFSSLPPKLADLPERMARTYNVIVIDVDNDPDRAFELVEDLCAGGRNYVMVYSASADMKLAVRFMRAGVREFFTLPLDPTEVSAALTQASTHRTAPTTEGATGGRLFVFLGTKGGCGVTTLAANFALALAQESDRETLLIDLGLPLGDAAINLGMVTEYSVEGALAHPERLDASMLSTLVAKHSSGLSVLGAPGEFPEKAASSEAIDKLVTVARLSFDFVVVDVGSRLDLMSTSLFDESSTIFLTTQVGLSEMRTANLMIKKFFGKRSQTLQIVLNRYKSSDMLFDDKKITEALTRPAEWKIPDDYAAVRRKRESATPMVMIDSAIAQSIRQMARTAGGLLTEKDERKGFFRFLR